jgi:Leucine-rich repeat (LRR) protein
VEDSEYLTNTTTKILNVSMANTPPTASFTVNPTTGTVDTVFDFDASGSSDNEDDTSVLQVRWDWNDDGTFDTNYNTTKTATQQYTLEGIYTVKLEVRDSEGWTHKTTKIVTVQRPSTVVAFSDANLEALIRVTLNKQGGDITDLDLESITALNGGGWNISDISGIEYCINLQNLDLRNNQINDISQLSDLVYLQTLSLLNNQISEISALSGLVNLEVLGLSGNQLIEIGSLGSLTNLNLLYLDNNQIINIISLSTLINLRELGLADNQIVDISPLINNGGINSGDTVYLTNNPLSNDSINNYIPLLEGRGVTVHY